MTNPITRALASLGSPRVDRALVFAVFGALAIARSGRMEERDPYWQARAGMENLAGWPLARPDTWTWSPPSGLWYQSSPLWNDVLGLSYQAAGFWGLFWISTVLVFGYLWLAYLVALQFGARRLPALFGVLLAVLPAWSMLNPRGTLVVEAIVLAAVLMALKTQARLIRIKSAAVMAGLVFVAGAGLSTIANGVHLSFLLLSPAMVLMWASIWWFGGAEVSRRWWLIAGSFGWLLGPILSPYGLDVGLAHSSAVATICAGLIPEWSSPFIAGGSPVFWVLAVAALAVALGSAASVIVGWLRGDRGDASGGAIALCLIGVPAAFAGLSAVRFLGIAILTLAPVLAAAVAEVLDTLRTRSRVRLSSRWQEFTDGSFWRVVIAATVALLLPGVWYLGSLHAEPAEAKVVSQLPTGCRLFAAGGVSGTAILIRPDAQPWIDGRADFFGRERLMAAYRYFAVQAADLVPEGTTCILLDADDQQTAALAAAVDSSPAWRRSVTEGDYRIWVPAGS
jgi:hypothetical protein